MGGPRVLGVSMDRLAVQGAGAFVGIEAVHEQVGRIEVDAESSGVEAIEESTQHLA